MSDIFDYLDWRGDLSFEAAPFNEVDSLIMCKLCCVELRGIVPEGDGAGLTVTEASRIYFEEHDGDTGKQGVLCSPGILPMFKVLPDYPRFAGLVISNYVSRIDTAAQEQFSAMTVSGFPDGSHYIAFRGTDDTIIAWKENLNMGAADCVPAQVDAANYLERAAWLCDGALRVGGHSKGGNLAVYSAIHADAEVKDRIIDVWNFDGPGFREGVLESPKYQSVRERIITLVPQYSLVGMLLCHEEDYEIVRSDETGISAHDGFTWEVLGTRFVRCSDFAFRSRVMDSAFRGWAADMTLEQRQEFADAAYAILTSTGAETLSDLNEHKLRQAMELIGTLRAEPRQRELLTETLELLIRESVSNGIRSIHLPRVRMPSLPKMTWRRKKDAGDPET